MPLPDRREYRKKQPFRDATLFVIICEGERRHFTKTIPEMTDYSASRAWKSIIPQINPGGFDCSRHPALIETATLNDRSNYSVTGYLPDTGTTQVFILAEKILPLVKKFL